MVPACWKGRSTVRAAATDPLPLTATVRVPWLTVALVPAVDVVLLARRRQKTIAAIMIRMSGMSSQRRQRRVGRAAPDRSRVPGNGTEMRIARNLHCIACRTVALIGAVVDGISIARECSDIVRK